MVLPRRELMAVLVGHVKPFGPNGERSGILKTSVVRPVSIGRWGIIGDEQAAKNHGGSEKAVHHYAFDHYIQWKTELSTRACCFMKPGAFGENFSTIGMTEASVCVGDVYQVGAVLLQVSQGRQPCWKLNVRFDNPAMAQTVQHTGRTGWYYRVLNSGRVQVGDAVSLVERPNAEWPLSRLLYYLYIEKLNREALDQIARMPFLTESWRRLARLRLSRHAVENWTGRLNVPAHGI